MLIPAAPWRRRIALAVALVLGLAVWLAMRSTGPTDNYAGVALLWFLSMAVVVVASWSDPARDGRSERTEKLDRSDWVILAALAVGGLILRTVELDQLPFFFGGD